MKSIKKIACYLSHGKKAWYQSHVNDAYVKKAQKANYRSRAAFKLIDIAKKYQLSGQKILDLGCSPGSWSQVAKELKPNSIVVGIDLLETKPIDGVDLYEGDARSQKFHSLLGQKYGKFDLFLSDMAPNFTGEAATTHEQIIELNTLCVGLTAQLGCPSSNLVMKTTYGHFQKNFYHLIQQLFEKVNRYKPEASRSQSIEFYYICQKLKQKYRGRKGFWEHLQTVRIQQLRNKNQVQKVLENN